MWQGQQRGGEGSGLGADVARAEAWCSLNSDNPITQNDYIDEGREPVSVG